MLFHITDLIFLCCLTAWEKDVRDMSSAVWVQYSKSILQSCLVDVGVLWFALTHLEQVDATIWKLKHMQL